MRLFQVSLCAIAAAILLAAGSAGACMSSKDCGPNTQCRKSSPELPGICMGTLEPGDGTVAPHPIQPYDPTAGIGFPCQFITDCGPGTRCVRNLDTGQGSCQPTN
ncbi:MAG: hypothetical protein O7G30_17900 [Proteobacteria bacterium]|nr:hypothetical protein [Pseudomonadota bacterium]